MLGTHATVSVLSPWQVCPPREGAGLSHDLDLDLVPFCEPPVCDAHVTEQAENGPQSLQPPGVAAVNNIVWKMSKFSVAEIQNSVFELL